MDIGKLKEKLERITDPRRQWGNLRHKLEDILVIALATLLCGGEDFQDMETFGQDTGGGIKKVSGITPWNTR